MIDNATVQKILNTADIIDVVSDFVSLKRRGASYVGLCPFHNEKTPSFYVTPSKGICHCFGCGKGGSPVNFIMEYEQLSYHDALLYLANKYHIEVHERELTDEEKEQQSERESMFVINEFATRFFEKQLNETQQGQDIGMAYFKERGFNADSIKKFRLGYSPENSHALYDAAIAAGYNRKLLFDVGLCIDDKRGGGYDRFRGRCMFPVLNVAGKVVAFGGRTLKNDPAKYVNSPESIIYNKRNELYGLFQAKREIVNTDKCFLVEGYADVISMHQSGFTNVIASSGTSLTTGHIHLLHRFTENVTELFDGDAAGIHAALRGIDMLLEEGLNIKVLLLPNGEDPDSFARSHSTSQVQDYIDQHETDFIKFKTQILLKDAQDDPIKKAAVIGDVVRSISVIPNEITRQVYAKECSASFGISEDVLLREIAKNIRQRKEADRKQKERDRLRQQAQASGQTTTPAASPAASDSTSSNEQPASQPVASALSATQSETQVDSSNTVHKKLVQQERNVTRFIVKYGMCYLCEMVYDDTSTVPATVVEYIYSTCGNNDMHFTDDVCRQIFDLAINSVEQFYDDLDKFKASQDERVKAEVNKQLDAAGDSIVGDTASIEAQTNEIKLKVQAQASLDEAVYRSNYLIAILCSHPNDAVRSLATKMATDRQQLSKIHTQYGNVQSEFDRLPVLVPEAISNWQDAILLMKIEDINKKLKENSNASDALQLMQQLQKLYEMRKQLAKLIGDRVVNPFIMN